MRKKKEYEIEISSNAHVKQVKNEKRKCNKTRAFDGADWCFYKHI